MNQRGLGNDNLSKPNNVIVAIDGPSGSGKSSTSRAIAKRAGWEYLDTGALYRAATWIALELLRAQESFNGKSVNFHEADLAIQESMMEALSEEALENEIAQRGIFFSTNPENPTVHVGKVDVTTEIRSLRITKWVSYVSKRYKVREVLFTLQREIIESAKFGIVVEGRDIGTVVCPDAQLKIFLHAQISARTSRREKELDENGIEVTTQQVEESLTSRDEIDSQRTISPLTPAEDCVEIDTTLLDLDEVIDYVWKLLERQSLIGLPTLAVIGRPNVGKSTLVNRLIGRREAIVEDSPGVTRDRVRYEAEWGGKRFYVMDTGGWEARGITLMSEKISGSAVEAIEESDLLLFVVDAQVGAVDEDRDMIDYLRKVGKKTLLIANKVDGPNEELEAHSLWNIGLGEPHFISSLHGRGAGDLLDLVVKELPEVGTYREDPQIRRVALLGRPNVGKSSFLNAVAGEQRVIVADEAGTTRDPVDELVQIGGDTWKLIDTAGIRRKAQHDSGTDYYAYLRTAAALERAEVAVIIFDASVPLTEQDIRILTMADEAGRAIVLVMNKWDLVDEERQYEVEKELERELERYPWVQRVNVSAKTGWHRDRLAPALRTALKSWEKRVPTSKLNSFLGSLVSATPPPVRGGKQPKIKFATQAAISPPKFVVFATEFVETSYRRFIERRIREEFGFPGTPIEVAVKVRED